MLIMWIITGIVGAAAVMIGLFRFAAAWRPQPDRGDLPTTPLERLGWTGLWVTGAVGAGMVVLAATNGAARLYENDASRRIFTILLLVGIAVWAAVWRVVSRPQGGAVIDERDRDILARSFSVESVVVILSLVLWTVVLTEVYGDEGAVPIGYLQLIFWSTFILGAFGRSLGIVLGYRRGPMVDA
jgi:hypothetical protein